MFPKLFSVPLPHTALPVGVVFLVLAGIGALLALVGFVRARKLSTLVTTGLLLAIAGALLRFVWLPNHPDMATYELSPVPIYSYGVMLGLSLVVGWYLTLGLAGKDGLPRDMMANCYVFTAVSAVLGSRILFVLTNLDQVHEIGDVFAMRNGGLVAYGGFLGGYAGSWLFLNYKLHQPEGSAFPRIARRRYPVSILPWADVAVPSLASGLMITRIGCYLFGCDFGRPLSEGAPAWLKKLGTFPRWAEGTLPDTPGSPAWALHTRPVDKGGFGLSLDATHSLPVHPTQIYESLVGLGLLVMLLAMRKRQKFRGEIFLLFTFAYGACRYALEIVRGDDQRGGLPLAMPAHVLLPLGFAVIALGFVIGFSQLVENMTLRRVLQIASFAPAVAFFLATKPASFAQPEMMQYSTSQVVAMVTALASGVGFSILWSSAKEHPEAAMALHLPPEGGEDDAALAKKSAEVDDADEDDEDEEKEAAPKQVAQKAKPKRARKKIVAPPPDEEPEGEEQAS